MEVASPNDSLDGESVMTRKGLVNFTGENNCFLNVIIQSLWHLRPFRRYFTGKKMVVHRHRAHCVFCSLQTILVQYKHLDESSLPPDALRSTMAVLYKAEQKFQLNDLDDAGEAFDAVLSCLHEQLADSPSEDLSSTFAFNSLMISGKPMANTAIISACKDSSCVSHRVFGIHTVSQLQCSGCYSSNEPAETTVTTVYAYAAGLKLAMTQFVNKERTVSFDQLLRAASEDSRSCPNDLCHQHCTFSHFLCELPEVFSINVVFEQQEPSLAEVTTFLGILDPVIDLSVLFDQKPKTSQHKMPPNAVSFSKKLPYKLRGMVCYYGKHFNAYFLNPVSQEWYMFDDCTVKPVGNDWQAVKDRCAKGRLMPSLLFFEKDSDLASAVSVSPQSVSTKSQESVQHATSHFEVDIQNSTVNQEPNPVLDQSLANSFVMIPSEKSNKVHDFVITRTNWMYRQQVRLFRITPDCFMRVQPEESGSGEVKEGFTYRDILEISFLDSNSFVISGREAQHIRADRANEIVSLLVEMAAKHGHKFTVKKM